MVSAAFDHPLITGLTSTRFPVTFSPLSGRGINLRQESSGYRRGSRSDSASAGRWPV